MIRQFLRLTYDSTKIDDRNSRDASDCILEEGSEYLKRDNETSEEKEIKTLNHEMIGKRNWKTSVTILCSKKKMDESYAQHKLL